MNNTLWLHEERLDVFRTLVQDDIPMNAGCLKPLKISFGNQQYQYYEIISGGKGNKS